MKDRRELYDEWCKLARKVEGMKFIFQNKLDVLEHDDLIDYLNELNSINIKLEILTRKSLKLLFKYDRRNKDEG